MSRRLAVTAPFEPAGDQPAAIAALAGRLSAGERFSVLHGITGSGKSATIAWTLEAVQRPALIIAPNKALAAQLAGELSQLLSGNRVTYFVSYYDFYQPEAYVPSSDMFIEKTATINQEINRLRHATTSALLSRRDVVVVASVSCIYGLGDPQQYARQLVPLSVGADIDLFAVLARLVDVGFTRNDVAPTAGCFRLAGDTLDVFPADRDGRFWRVRLDFDQVDSICEMDAVSGATIAQLDEVTVFPATHFSLDAATLSAALADIEADLAAQLDLLRADGRLLEAARLEQRVRLDLEMLANTGSCAGVENYSRYFERRPAGSRPFTLLDYFPDDFVCFLDESHQTLPQLRGAYPGDAHRKDTLVEHGFRLPAARNNRPLTIGEFFATTRQLVFVSATPGPEELELAGEPVELVVRPTGLVDPPVEVVPKADQLLDLLRRSQQTIRAGARVLVTTVTKRMAEDVVDWLSAQRVNARYLHSDIDTSQRMVLLRALRSGEIDVLVGVNLLREGLDLPEVALVAVLDADVEGLFRSFTGLIQTFGRAARNVDGRVVCYADRVTPALQRAIDETNRRRARQMEHNERLSITPRSVSSPLRDLLVPAAAPDTAAAHVAEDGAAVLADMSAKQLAARAAELETLMLAAASRRCFEEASRWRDELEAVEAALSAGGGGGGAAGR